LIAALLATIIAVIVPVMTFRLALRQDQSRWIREQRADLYMDMLTEAYAEQEWLKLETAPESIQERAGSHSRTSGCLLWNAPGWGQGNHLRQPGRQPTLQPGRRRGVPAAAGQQDRERS